MKRNSSTNTRTHALGSAGFTLVELLIVIAILAILAGIGAVGYTGYIEYTKKGLDKQTVGEIIHALEIAHYADPTLFGDNPSGTVLLSSNGAVGTTPAVQKALDDAGISTKLSYGKWKDATGASSITGNVGSLITEKLPYINGSDVKIGYAETASECWDAVRAVSALMAEKNQDSATGDLDNYAVMLVLQAAQAANASNTALSWQNNFNFNAGELEEVLPSYVARNYAFAAYLEKNYNYEGIGEDLKALRGIPEDQITKKIDMLTDSTYLAGKNEEYKNAAQAYLSSEVYNNAGNSMSQAAIDSAAYYAFMEGMYNQYKDNIVENPDIVIDPEHPEIKAYKYGGDIDSFWEQAGGYISTAADLANMNQGQRNDFLSKLPASGSVVQIKITGRNNGALSISVLPNSEGLDPREKNEGEGGCTHEHTTEPCSFDISKGSQSFNVSLCLKAGITTCQLKALNSGSDMGFGTFTVGGVKDGISFDKDSGIITVTKVPTDGTSYEITLTRRSVVITIKVEVFPE